MAILKCKMCGGDLNIQDGMTVAECEYCGTRQTVPTADNEKKMTLFARANRLRAACEFDKAAGVYESIVAEFPEEAEAYWGLLLCKYGIEYVDDPATGKKIPTCHRSSFDSIMDDSDFEQVMENADAIARRVYREEAKTIEELRKNIIEVSSKEEPYDIFICYKETDENGNRTVDSVIAQDIYKALTDEGYRVFFSRITLEDKLGQEYEPYIFAALNSAKVMLAVGTDYEYYNAVWVKNEWSRFLALIAKGEKKTLIPCYKDIDAYDMPKEFRRLQAQDMGKIGATQDLLRGIGKILGVKSHPVVTNSDGANAETETMKQRGYMALEDGEIEEAKRFFERALDINPSDGRAYLGKFLAQYGVASLDDFDNKVIYQPESNKHFKRAEQFADSALADELRSFKRTNDIKVERLRLLDVLKKHLKKTKLEAKKVEIKERTYLEACELQASGEETKLAEASKIFAQLNGYKDSTEKAKVCRYEEATKAMNAASSESDYKEASRLYGSVPGYRDADDLSKECLVKAESARKDSIYDIAVWRSTSNSVDFLEQAASEFRTIPGWKDADKLAKECAEKAEALHNDPIYSKATSVMKSAKTDAAYEDASKIFKTISGWKDADKLAAECDEKAEIARKDSVYEDAAREMKKNTIAGFNSAKEQFKKIPGYKDADKQISACEKGIADLELSAKKKKKRNITIGSIAAVVVAAIVVFVIVLNTVIIPNNLRSEAKTLAENGKYTQAANKYMQAGLTEKTKSLYWEYSRNQISAGGSYTVGLKSDGTVVAVGYNDDGRCDVQDWKDIVAVSAGDDHTVGLKSDGTVVAVGKDYGQCDVKDWKNIVSVSAGDDHTVGLKSDGTVVAVGNIYSGQCDVKDWKDIVAVSAGSSHTVGLKSDGTVVAVGPNDNGRCDVKDWKNIVAVSAGCLHTVGLSSDGTVVAVGSNDFGIHNCGQCDVQDWKDIVAVSAGDEHTVGLKSDGTVVAVGANGNGQCDVKDWKDIVAVSAGDYYTVGLKSDGTVVAVGGNSDGERNVSDWKLW